MTSSTSLTTKSCHTEFIFILLVFTSSCTAQDSFIGNAESSNIHFRDNKISHISRSGSQKTSSHLLENILLIFY